MQDKPKQVVPLPSKRASVARPVSKALTGEEHEDMDDEDMRIILLDMLPELPFTFVTELRKIPSYGELRERIENEVEYYKAGANKLSGTGGKLLLADMDDEHRASLEEFEKPEKSTGGDFGSELFSMIDPVSDRRKRLWSKLTILLSRVFPLVSKISLMVKFVEFELDCAICTFALASSS